MTKIEWAEKVFNPITGCTKTSPGCINCYGESMAKRFWGGRKFTDIQFHEDRLDQPLSWKRPSKIFVCSMSDLFHEQISFYQLDKIFWTIVQSQKRGLDHIFILLTKRPSRMWAYLEDTGHWALDNIWVGVTAENQEMADKRIPILLKIPAAVRFVSIEPMLGPVNMTTAMYGNNPAGMNCFGFTDGFGYEAYIQWIICGSESGPKRRPAKLEWIRNIRDQCIVEGNIPFFLKQMEINGKLAKMPQLDGHTWNQMP